MTIDEYMAKMLAVDPTLVFGEDQEGQVIMFSGRYVVEGKDELVDISEIDDLETFLSSKAKL